MDWADPQEEPDEGTMSKVKVLYVRNLTQEISEEKLKVSKMKKIKNSLEKSFLTPQEHFENYGKVERVKKIKDYAFVHFEDRDNAVLAMRDLDGKDVGGSHIEVSGNKISASETLKKIFLTFQVSLAKPPSDKKKKEEVLRARERRMMQMMQGRSGIVG